VHYRSTVEFSDDSLAEATSTWERVSGFVTRAVERVGQVPAEEVTSRPISALPPAFVAAMADDLTVPAALAAVRQQVGAGPHAAPWVTAARSDDAAREALDVLVPVVLAERADARKAKDWARADALRDQLQAAGIIIEDSPDGARWQLGTRGGR